MNQGNQQGVQIAISLAMLAAYFAPAIIAFTKHREDRYVTLAINFFLGWSLIGWGVALYMALRTPPEVKRQLMAEAVAVGVRQANAQPAPGWYKDPSGKGAQRWWDGSAWTNSAVDSAGQPLPPT